MRYPLFPLTIGAVCVLGLAIGFKVLNHHRNTVLQAISHQTGDKVRNIQLQATSKKLDSLNHELRQHEEALKTLPSAHQQGNRGDSAERGFIG